MLNSKDILKLQTLLLILLVPTIIYAQGDLSGKWKYIFPGGEMKMEINRTNIIIDGVPYSYKTENNNLMVYDGYVYTAYPYTLNGNQLTLIFPGNTQFVFTRESVNSVTDSNSQGPLKVPPASTQGPIELSLKGKWQYQTPEINIVLEFLPGNQLIFNNETTQYQLLEGIIQAMGDYGWINYPYLFSNGKLLISFPDGSQVPFTKVNTQTSDPASINNQSSGGTTWQLQGSLCYWSGSSGSSSSYSRSEKIVFDGKGNFTYGKESSFSGNAGVAYSGNPNADRGTYRIEGKFVSLQFLSGESYKLEVIMQQNNGRITELMFQGKLYATSLCE